MTRKRITPSVPMPADFADNAFKAVGVLRCMYRTSYERIKEWRDRLGITTEMLRAANTWCPPTRPQPTDFMTVQDGMTTRQLSEYYGCSNKLITRWLGECGIHRKADASAAKRERDAERPVRVQRSRKTPSTSEMGNTAWGSKALLPQKDTRVDAQAADFLRRDCAVYRCGEAGGADQTGSFWRYGRAIYTPDDLVAKAVRRGWKMAA